MITRSEIVRRIAEQIPALPTDAIELSISHLLEYLSHSLGDGDRIEIRGFGSFSLRYRAPRSAHNPKTRDKVATVAKYAITFKAGKELRERLNGQRN